MAQMTRQQVAREQITVRDSVPTRRIEEPYVPEPRFHDGNWYDIIDGISDPEHADHEERREWLGRDFDPDAFSADAVNRRLVHLQRRRLKTTTTSKTNPSLQ